MTSPLVLPHLSQNWRLGRPEAQSGTDYAVIPGVNGESTSQSYTANRDYFSPWFAFTPTLISALYIDISGAGSSNIRIGFYASDVNWQPVGPPLADSGDISNTTTGVKTYTPSTPVYVPAGRYLTVLNTQSNCSLWGLWGCLQQPIPSGMGSNGMMALLYATRTYAAFPNPNSGWTTNINSGDPLNNSVFYLVRQ